MWRLFWIGVGATAAVLVLRKARGLIDTHVPPGVSQAAGVVSGIGGALRSARSEFSAGLAEREAELRHDLLGDVDVEAARTRTQDWRAERSERSERSEHRGRSPRGGASSSGTDRGGRHADPDAEPAPQAQDADDGDLGYSFF